MDNQFLYEDGQGNVVDEYGRPEESMDYLVDKEIHSFQKSDFVPVKRDVALQRVWMTQFPNQMSPVQSSDRTKTLARQELYALETVSFHTQYSQSISHESNCESSAMHVEDAKDADVRMGETRVKRVYTAQKSCADVYHDKKVAIV
ncbi:hypothetical protein VTP01DRAFT_8170 [Rhizomucor pusillus]|uniref:uncharacterized protein n=1 Tax=Rhizomucor pusillus TaxID=4840 RepID=UPI0037437DBF